MRHLLLALMLLFSFGAFAQPAGHRSMTPPHGSMPMDHTQMLMPEQGRAAETGNSAGMPVQPGQAAFAAIQEIVQILEGDPHTDWSKVDIEALRQHLIDMNNVTLAAKVRNEPIDSGIRFVVTGTGPVTDSIRRMISAHTSTMDGFGGWHFTATQVDGGAILDVRVPERDLIKVKALGFIGVMTRGMHHQEHHLMIARGVHAHG